MPDLLNRRVLFALLLGSACLGLRAQSTFTCTCQNSSSKSCTFKIVSLSKYTSVSGNSLPVAAVTIQQQPSGSPTDLNSKGATFTLLNGKSYTFKFNILKTTSDQSPYMTFSITDAAGLGKISGQFILSPQSPNLAEDPSAPYTDQTIVANIYDPSNYSIALTDPAPATRDRSGATTSH
jgi:hypothetical protein